MSHELQGETATQDRQSRLARLRPSSPLGVGLLGLALLGLLALVAAVARAHHTPGGQPGIHEPPAGVGDYVFSIGAVVFVSFFLFMIYLWFSERDMLAQRRHKQRGSMRALIFIFVVAFVISLVARFAPDLLQRRQQQAKPQQGGIPGQATKKKRATPGQPRPPEFQWLPVFVATAAGMVLLGVIGVRRMRRARLGLQEKHLLELELESLLDDTLADLYSMKDPREAIIAAYGRMERLFGSYGLPRDPSEAPMEYLTRALGELRASGSALQRLTTLFQWAKFSTHDVDSAMRDDAIRALTLVRDELKANRLEDDVRRAEADAIKRDRAAEASSDRTFGEDPFATVGEKVKGDPYTQR
jgi:hypothetical protein